MGNVVNLKPASLVEDHSFIMDLARFRENLLDEKAIRKKYRLVDEADWQKMGEDDELIRKVEEESVRRIRTGASKREKAQLLVVAAPDVAASIMNRTDANDRHRLDAAKVLNDLAANPADSGPTTSDRFIITINLGADHVEHYEKSITIDANNGEPGDVCVAPTHTGYRQADHEVVTEQKKPAKTIKHEPVKTITDSRSAYEIALASLMEKG